MAKPKSKPIEITEYDMEQIGKLVAEGYTNGRLDDSDGKKIAWEIKMNAWQD
jgi:hypothetical protein